MQNRQRKITHFFQGIGISLGRLRPLARRQGDFGRIGVFQHPELGKVFVLDDEIQHVEAWAPLYHEPLVHLSASFVPVVRNVMILGGGTLYAAAEALKYKSVERVVVVDHDSKVPSVAAEFYDHAKTCFADNRFELIQENAYSYAAGFRNEFDLIINDGSDLMSVKTLKQKSHSYPNLFSVLTKALKPTGVCADVVYRHVFERERTLATVKHLRKRARLALSLVFLPEYHGILHVLCVWGKQSSLVEQAAARPRNKEQLRWVKDPQISPCEYYDPRFLSYYLYLPRYLKIALAAKKSSS